MWRFVLFLGDLHLNSIFNEVRADKRDTMIHFEIFSEIPKRNISSHIQCIKLQSVSPLIGNKCKCLVMPD